MVEEHSLRNRALLQRLRELGVDLSRPRPIDFHFWAGSQDDADRLEHDLKSIGMRVEALSSDEPGNWSVEAMQEVSPTQASDAALVERLARLAAKNRSEFDGWGTSVHEAHGHDQ